MSDIDISVGTEYDEGLKRLAEDVATVDESADHGSEGVNVFKLSLTELKSGIDLAGQGLEKLKELWDFAKAGAENERIAASFQETAADVGVSADAMSAALDRAANGTVDDEVYMQTATRNMALGVATTIQDNVAIMEMARASTRKFGGDTESAFEGISTAIGNLQTRQLKQYGIIIDAKQVNEEYAKTLGKTAEQLTEAEQREDLRNEVLRQSKDLVGTVGDAALTSAEKFKKMETAVGNAVDRIKEGMTDAVTPMIDRQIQLDIISDKNATTAEKLAAAQWLNNDAIEGAGNRYALYIKNLEERLRLEKLLGQTTEEQVVRAGMAHVRSLNEQADAMRGIPPLTREQINGLTSLAEANRAGSDATKEYNSWLRDQRSAYVDTFLTAIDYTQAEQREAEIKQKLSDLDAEIAKNGPARTAVIANERMTVEQRALAEAQLAAALEDTSTIKKRDKETDAEYQVRLEQTKNKVAELTAKLGEHAGVVGGATQEQLKQRDALRAQLEEFQRTQEIERATQAFQALAKAYQDGNITYDEFTVRSKTLNTVTGLYSDAALVAAQSQEALIKSLTTTGSNEWAAQMAANKDAIDGVADSMETAADKAGTSAEKTGAAAREVVTRSTNAKQAALDEMGNAVGDTTDKANKAISSAMLSLSNAATAAKGVAKTATNEIVQDWESVPPVVYTDYYIRTHGSVPTPDGESSLPTRAGGGDVMAGWPYWVGEEGPEPYVPAQNGRILSRTDAMSALSRSGGGDMGQIAGALNAMASAIQGLQRGGDLYLTTGPVLDDRTVDELAERVLRAWQSRQ